MGSGWPRTPRKAWAKAVEAGANTYAVATVAELISLEQAEREARILVMGPTRTTTTAAGPRGPRLELAVVDGRVARCALPRQARHRHGPVEPS